MKQQRFIGQAREHRELEHCYAQMI